MNPLFEAMQQKLSMAPELQGIKAERNKQDWATPPAGQSPPIDPQVLQSIGQWMHTAKQNPSSYDRSMAELATNLHGMGYDRASVSHMFDLASRGVGRSDDMGGGQAFITNDDPGITNPPMFGPPLRQSTGPQADQFEQDFNKMRGR